MMDQESTTAQPLIQPTDFRNAVIGSLLKESNALKLKIEHLEIRENAMEVLQNENDALKMRMKEWGELSNTVNRLEERIAGMLNTEKEELKVALVKKEARIGELEAEVSRIGALEARISGLLQWKSQQEQDTRERAVELERLMDMIQELQADAAKRTRAEAAGLQAEGGNRESLTEIAQGIKQSLQSMEESNKAVVNGFTDSTKNVGGLVGRLGLHSIYLFLFLWFLGKVWDWCTSYLSNFAASRTSVSVDDKPQG